MGICCSKPIEYHFDTEHHFDNSAMGICCSKPIPNYVPKKKLGVPFEYDNKICVPMGVSVNIFDVKKIKYIDCIPQSVQYSVNGYIRYYNIPEVISFIILSYYHSFEEYFVSIGDDVKLSNNNTKITSKFGKKRSNFGNFCIDSKNKTVCKWEIKVNCHRFEMIMGVTSNWTSNDKNFSNNTESSNYGYRCCGYKCSKNKLQRYSNKTWCNGDVIAIKLDLKKRNIEFFLNQKSQGIAYDDIDINQSYKLAIFIHGDESATIEGFEIGLKNNITITDISQSLPSLPSHRASDDDVYHPKDFQLRWKPMRLTEDDEYNFEECGIGLEEKILPFGFEKPLRWKPMNQMMII